MPPKLKTLSGDDVIKILVSFGFEIQSQKGSHVKLRRILSGQRQTLTIPYHREIDRGTFKAIIRQAARYISESDLNSQFYSE